MLIGTKNQLHHSFFLRYCKDFANLLFWAGLTTPTKIKGINLQDSLMFIYMQKITF